MKNHNIAFCSFVILTSLLFSPSHTEITVDQITSMNITVLASALKRSEGEALLHDMLRSITAPQSKGVVIRDSEPIGNDRQQNVALWEFDQGRLDALFGGYSLNDLINDGIPVDKLPDILPQHTGQPLLKNLPPGTGQPHQPPDTLAQLMALMHDNVDFSVSVKDGGIHPAAGLQGTKSFFCDLGVMPKQKHVGTSLDDLCKFHGLLMKKEERTIFPTYSAVDFAHYYAPLFAYYTRDSVELFLLQQYFLYRYQPYRNYLKTLTLYKPFILQLTDQMRKSRSLRARLDSLEGFECTRGLWNTGLGRTESEFRNWIYTEERNIKQELEQEKERAKEYAAAKQAVLNQSAQKAKQLTDVIHQTARAQHDWHAAEELRQKALVNAEVPDCHKLDDLADLLYDLSQQQNLDSLDQQEQDLVALGISCIEHAYTAHEQSRWRDFSSWYERSTALVALLTDPTVSHKNYLLSKSITTLLGPKQSQAYTSCHGNHLQHQLQRELVETLTQTADLWHAYKSDPYIDNFVQLTVAASDAGYAYNQEHAYQASMAQADYASSLFAVAKHWASFVKEGGWMLYQTAAITTEGIVQGSVQAIATLTQMIAHPIGTVADLLASIGKLGEFCLRAQMLVDNHNLFVAPRINPERAKVFCERYGLVQEAVDHALEQLYADPASIYKNGVAFLTEGMLVGKATGLASKGIRVACSAVTPKVINALKKALNNETKLAAIAEAALGPELAATEQAQALIKPVQTSAQEGMLKEAMEVIEAETIGTSYARHHIITTEEKTLVASIGMFEKATPGSLTFQGCTHFKNEELIREGLKKAHFDLPEIRLKSERGGLVEQQHFVGYHSTCKSDHTTCRILTKWPLDKNGCYKAIIEFEGLIKQSDFFPDHMSYNKIIQIAAEAFSRPIGYKDCGFIGKTLDDMLIRFWFRKTKDGLVMIDSFYPYLPTNQVVVEQLKQLRKQAYAYTKAHR